MTSQVREKRMESGLSVKELSEMANVSLDTIYRIEQPDTTQKTHIEVAEALAKALNTDESQLFCPSEITHLGRPPHTGGNYTRNPDTGIYGTLCKECNIYYPAHVGCENCG